MKRYEPAPYRIYAYGLLDARWADRLANMTISHTYVGNEVITTLMGEVTDQSELLGLLNTLNMLGLSLIRVECLLAPFQVK